MPLYEYSCSACSGKFDVLTSYSNREKLQVCPTCESTRTKVLVSSFAAFGAGEESGKAPVSLGGGGCGPGCCGGACSAN
ncbi:MAG: zinc ribbon domain-containing protein [Chloroflexi bacterium]|nr:MAG: zinc ribbon domain-containing protein [Chloroflexota bacterium]TMD54599.1 MAG: zinc ribbon domain-containing protein [Chloroflexota bacterium]